jgi:hypothetical protein
MVQLEKLPKELLNGKFLHCRPTEDAPVVEAHIFEAGKALPMAEKIIVCPARAPMSICSLTGDLCHYWRTTYIIGPDMDKKVIG